MQEIVSFDGTRIAFCDEGEGRPVLLLHGIFIPARAMFGPWSAMQAALGKDFNAIQTQSGLVSRASESASASGGLIEQLVDAGFRVIAPDMRGHGASDRPVMQSAYDHWAMARDAAVIIDRLAPDGVSIIGYSMGAINALRLLALGQRRIGSVVLGGMGPSLSIKDAHWSIEDWERYSTDAYRLPRRERAELDNWEAWTAYASDALLGKRPAFGVARGYCEFTSQIGFDKHVAAAIIRSLGKRADVEMLEWATMPVLSINGDEDVIRKDVENFSAILPQTQFFTANGNHISAIFDDSFKKAVVDFLESNA